MPWIPLAIGAATALASARQKQQQESRDRMTQAATTRWSPYTGMHANAPDHTNVMGETMGGAAAGAGFGQNLQASQDQHDWMRQGFNPNGFGNGPGNPNGFQYGTAPSPTGDYRSPTTYRSKYFGDVS